MRIFDVATEVIKQGGKRRGANMGILRVDHPDIVKFIMAKSEEGALRNFNISVAVTDEFMECVEENREYPLINPRTGSIVKRIPANDIFSLIVSQAWRTGDPGLIFLDEINRCNPTLKLGAIEATNPCGEVPLLPYESCNLGSVNLSRFVDRKNGDVDWDRLAYTVREAVHFLDNIIDVNKYPLPEIERMTKLNRKIGLGVMGFAEMLIQLGIPYDSVEAVSFAEKLMRFISETAREKSVELGRIRGSFPSFEDSIWAGRYDALRNATLTSIAPTGSISIIAGTSSSIEPLFAVAYVREVLEGTRLIDVNRLFVEVAKERGFYSDDLIVEVARRGTVKGVQGIPEDVKKVFVTALEIDPRWHVEVQAAFQRYVDNAVAKTVNLPSDATLEDVRRIFMLAYKLKCKGVTVYRYGSKPQQVLYVGASEEAGCPSGVCPI
jgi:ribonucleoside-diphosphate reductase alpha chain